MFAKVPPAKFLAEKFALQFHNSAGFVKMEDSENPVEHGSANPFVDFVIPANMPVFENSAHQFGNPSALEMMVGSSELNYPLAGAGTVDLVMVGSEHQLADSKVLVAEKFYHQFGDSAGFVKMVDSSELKYPLAGTVDPAKFGTESSFASLTWLIPADDFVPPFDTLAGFVDSSEPENPLVGTADPLDFGSEKPFAELVFLAVAENSAQQLDNSAAGSVKKLEMSEPVNQLADIASASESSFVVPAQVLLAENFPHQLDTFVGSAVMDSSELENLFVDPATSGFENPCVESVSLAAPQFDPADYMMAVDSSELKNPLVGISDPAKMLPAAVLHHSITQIGSHFDFALCILQTDSVQTQFLGLPDLGKQ